MAESERATTWRSCRRSIAVRQYATKWSQRFDAERMKRWPNVDGVFAATHTTGCALEYQWHQTPNARPCAFGLRQPSERGRLLGDRSRMRTDDCRLLELNITAWSRLYAPGGEQLTRDDGIPMLTMQTEGGTRATIDKAEAMLRAGS